MYRLDTIPERDGQTETPFQYRAENAEAWFTKKI